jgi:hypothetical protein
MADAKPEIKEKKDPAAAAGDSINLRVVASVGCLALSFLSSV